MNKDVDMTNYNKPKSKLIILEKNEKTKHR